MALSFTRPLTLAVRFLQWSSAVIVMGITSDFINNYAAGEHIIYTEVIACISIVAFMPAFASSFMPAKLSPAVLAIDLIFSYLWLVAVVFSAEMYDWKSCLASSPPGFNCSIKDANQAFMFLTFFFTVLAIPLELSNLWAVRRESAPSGEKFAKFNNTTGRNAPLDAPADNAAAGSV